MPNVTWLHLSDIHFHPKSEWNANPTRTALLAFLKAKFECHPSLKPDFIVCTGDIAFGTTQGSPLSSQYAFATEFFEQLLQCCGDESKPLEKQRLFLVPGNHDINRHEVSEIFQDSLIQMAKKSDQYIDKMNERFATNNKDIRDAMTRLSDYNAFIKEYLPHQYDEEGRCVYTNTFTLNDINIGITGFNSAWSCAGPEDDRHLWFAGNWQFHQAESKLANQELRIGLIHHPIDNLAQAERNVATRRFKSGFDFLLHGHSHNAWIDTGQDLITIAAGATGADSAEEFGFNITQVDLMTGTGKTWLYTYSPNDHDWVISPVPKYAPEGVWSFELPKKMQQKGIKKSVKSCSPKTQNTDVISGFGIPKQVYNVKHGTALSVLLHSSEAVVPFDPLREVELSTLIEWSTETEFPISIRLMKGEGGVGKTRLAIELCHRLKQQQWCVGLLDKDQNHSKLARVWKDLLVTGKPCLIVIDYAETQTREFLGLLKIMLSSPGDQKVCLLLLARDGGEWWENLAAKDAKTESILAGQATKGPYSVLPLYDNTEQRQQGYKSALSSFEKVLNLKASTIIPDLTGDHFGKPLFIQMAALLMLYGERPKSANGITRAILNHEQRYWSGALINGDVRLEDATSRKLLALVTLAGHFSTARDAKVYWDIADNSSLSANEFRKLFNCLSPLYPTTQGLQGLKPDLLGEALVAEMLGKEEGSALLSAVLSPASSNKIKLNALTMIARISLYKKSLYPMITTAFEHYITGIGHELVAVIPETDNRLVQLAVNAIGQLKIHQKNSVAGQLVSILPDESVALGFLSCEVAKIIYEKEKRKLQKKPQDIKMLLCYASALHNYSSSLYEIGNYKEACIKIKEVVDLFEQTSIYNSTQFKNYYTAALSNYSLYSEAMGENELALIILEKIIDIEERSTLKSHAPDDFDQALFQNNYANILQKLGKVDQALIEIKKSLVIRKNLSLDKTEDNQHYYAKSLAIYASILGRKGQNVQCMKALKEALDSIELLALKNPDKYEPDYGSFLANHAGGLFDAGHYSLATSAQDQSLEIFKRLYKKLPKAYAYHLVCVSLFGRIIQWAANENPVQNTIIIDENLLQHLEVQELSAMKVYELFFEALTVTETMDRISTFERILSVYKKMSVSEKNNVEEFWHFSVAWLYQQGIRDEQIEQWPYQWQKFKEKRQNNVPNWMLDFSKRLGVEWPKIDLDHIGKSLIVPSNVN
jgi:tetratricopeptide (TPR) repeat protein/predicted phosphodiesterase